MTEADAQSGWLPDKRYFVELLRPWKLITFGLGMAYLFIGALYYHICDWDIGVSVIMGGLTYLFAPWSAATIYQAARYRRPGWGWRLLAALLPALFTVDWVYWLYHHAVGNQMLRWENFKVSMPLYFICGIFWYYPGSINDLLREIRAGRGVSVRAEKQ